MHQATLSNIYCYAFPRHSPSPRKHPFDAFGSWESWDSGPSARLTCVSESMDEAASRFPVVHRVAGSPKDKETPASFGLIASSDQWVLLAEFSP